jgi:hypothetical protein
MPSTIQLLSALYLVLPSLTSAASIPYTQGSYTASETVSATESASSALPTDAAFNSTEIALDRLASANGTDLLNSTLASNVSVSDTNVTALLEGYDLALLAYENGTAYIINEYAEVECTGVDECKVFLETVGVEEIECDGDDDEDEDDSDDCEYTDGQEIPETPEIPESPNGADGSDSPDSPDTPDSPDVSYNPFIESLSSVKN